MTIKKTLPAEYLSGISLFNEGLYYEAHEEWEKIWLKAEGVERIFYQSLIQAAAALLKAQGDKKAATQRLYEATLLKLAEIPPNFLGMDIKKFEVELRNFFKDFKNAPKIVLTPP